MNFCFIAQLILISAAVAKDASNNTQPSGGTAADVKNLKDLIANGDSKGITKLLVTRTHSQREEIKKLYKADSNQSLLHDIFERTKDKSQLLMFTSRLLYTTESFPARSIRFSLYVSSYHPDLIPKDWGYMSVIATTDGVQLKAIAEEYERLFNTSLKDDCNEKMKIDSGKRFMASVIDAALAGQGRASSGVDPSKFKESYNVVPKKGGHCAFDKNKDLYNLLTLSSFEHLKEFSKQLKHDKNRDLLDEITNHCGDGEVREAYMRIIRYAVDPSKYYANDLHYGFQGFKEHLLDGVDRVLITRKEIDLNNINAAYKDLFNHDIKHSIKFHFHKHMPDYEDVLNALMDDNPK